MSKIIKIRIGFVVLLVIIILCFLYLAIVPGGHITYVNNFTADNYFIKKLTPVDRVETIKDDTQKVIGDPVYFTLRTPRRFEQAHLTIKYKSSGPQLLLEAGVLADKTIWRYDLQPLDNKIIDQLSLAWPSVRDNETILLQKKADYKSVAEFLKNLPPREQIALYNYDLKNNFILPEYTATTKNRKITQALRGSYQFYTYIKKEDLNFDFVFFDLNQNRDADPIDLNLYYQNKLLESRHLGDDGISQDNGQISGERTMKLELANLPEGVYKIELRVNNDIVTKTIATKQSKLAFINKIWLNDNGVSSLSLYTNSQAIGFMTTNPAKLQTIKSGGETFVLGRTYAQITGQTNSSTTKIVLAKDDITVSGDKFFSFLPTELINPDYTKVDANLNINQSGVKYVLAKYNIPQVEGEWQIVQADFDLSNAYRETLGILPFGPSQYSFMLSIPGLIVQNAVKEYVVIDEIKVELTGTSLFKKFFNK